MTIIQEHFLEQLSSVPEKGWLWQSGKITSDVSGISPQQAPKYVKNWNENGIP